MPEYVTALDRSGNPVGYVESRILGDSETIDMLEGWIPVYSESLEEVVGHMVDGYGFIPAGGDVEDHEPFEVIVDPDPGG